jgi:hypothetical protein
MHYWIVNGKQMTEAEYQDHQRQELEARERVQREAAALVKKLGQTYEALTSLMQQHPEVDREITTRQLWTKRFTRSCGRTWNWRTRLPGAAG